MNTKRIITWGSFIVVIALIVWGLIAAGNKAARENANLPSPEEVTSSDWAKGSASSTVTIIEYSDFQCPACRAYFSVIQQLIQDYGSKILFVYRHFPLPQHANAMPAARAAEAAGKQGKFWEMYEAIFTNFDVWEESTDSPAIFAGYAEGLGLDMTKYSADVASKEVQDKINMDLKGGQKAGINSTPTFYLNGKKIQNPAGYEEFKKIIDEALTNTTQS